MTPLAWDAKQGNQGLALERGSLVTIVNNSKKNLNPGDVVAWDIPEVEYTMPNVRDIDKNKLLAKIVREDDTKNFKSNQVIGMVVSRAKSGHAVDILMGGPALMNTTTTATPGRPADNSADEDADAVTVPLAKGY